MIEYIPYKSNSCRQANGAELAAPSFSKRVVHYHFTKMIFFLPILATVWSWYDRADLYFSECSACERVESAAKKTSIPRLDLAGPGNRIILQFTTGRGRSL